MTPNAEERWRLVHSHRYSEALAAYEAELKGHPKFLANLIAWRARMLLCLGRLEEALAGFIEANELETRKWKGANQPHWKAIAAIEWMLGRREEAISTMQRTIDAIAGGTITYTDTSHGARDGLLLWYFGVSARDERVRRHGLQFLKDLSERWPLDEFWPGPVALCVLGQLRFEQLPEYVARYLEPAMNEHAASIGKRRTSCHILFYQAVHRRAAGDEAGCLRAMRECYAVENPIDEQEWYLARHETEHSVLVNLG